MGLMDTDLVFATPRKLPRASSLRGRVVVLDIAFAADGKSGGFLKKTGKFIDQLGDRLAAWVDHHDHERHADYRGDERFVLTTKAEHGACPELITPELVRRVGKVDTIVCHNDFDGLSSAAKWLRDGVEPYPGCDDDARSIDTRMGQPSQLATTIDRALRASPRDTALFGTIVKFLVDGGSDHATYRQLRAVAERFAVIEKNTHRIARGYARLSPGVAVVNVSGHRAIMDKTELLLLGQEREPISMIIDDQTLNIAARFDSGIDLLKQLGISGGMPTRVSVPRSQLANVCKALGLSLEEVRQIPTTDGDA